MKTSTILAASLLAFSLPGFAVAQQSQHASQPQPSQAASQASCPDEAALQQNSKDKTITAAERQKARDGVFNALDGDHNGVVSRAEYVHCLVETPDFKKAGAGAAAVKK